MALWLRGKASVSDHRILGDCLNTRDAARLLRSNLTPAEQRLWSVLRRRQLAGLRFRRQHVIGRFIADFYCPEARLVIEVDGGIHSSPEQRMHDRERDTVFAALGLIVCRVTNDDVFRDVAGVLQRIRSIVALLSPPADVSKDHAEQTDT